LFRAARCFSRMWVSLIMMLGVATACEAQQTNDSSTPPKSSQDLVWSFMVNDSEQDARIKKWTKKTLHGLVIVDQDRAAFYEQFSPLLREVGKSIDVDIETCSTVVGAGAVVQSSGPKCPGAGLDFYYVITNGSWTDSHWKSVKSILNNQAAEELVFKLREQLSTAPSGRTCRVVTRTKSEIGKDIVLAADVIDSKEPKVLGTCATYGFLHMLGLYPFDGARALAPSEEAESMAQFLLKQDPYGGVYLLRLLYSPSVKAGMTETEFEEALSEDSE